MLDNLPLQELLVEVDHVFHSLLLKVNGPLSEETWGAFAGSSLASAMPW